MIRSFFQFKRLFFACTSIFILVAVTSCTTKNEFLASSVIPAARGYVQVKKDKNQNYLIQVHLEYLAEADRLQPPKQTYVIWMVSKDDVTKNIGQINSSARFLSNNLKASFETVSSVQPIRIYITAEDDGGVTYPGPQVVLTTDKLY